MRDLRFAGKLNSIRFYGILGLEICKEEIGENTVSSALFCCRLLGGSIHFSLRGLVFESRGIVLGSLPQSFPVSGNGGEYPVSSGCRCLPL